MLRDGTGEPLIHYLHDHHIPFIVVSGFAFKMRGRVHARQVLEKPVAGTRVLRELAQAIDDQPAPVHLPVHRIARPTESDKGEAESPQPAVARARLQSPLMRSDL